MKRLIKKLAAIMTASILTVNAMTVSVFAEETATPTDAGNGTISIEDYCYGGVLPIPQIDTTTYDITQVVVEYKNRDADDESYSLEQPTQIGEYTARATFAQMIIMASLPHIVILKLHIWKYLMRHILLKQIT